MIRSILAAFALSFVGSFAVAEGPTPPVTVPEFAIEVEQIKRDVEKKLAPIYAAVEKEYEAAKTESDRASVLKKSSEESGKIYAPAREQVMKLLRPNAKDPAAITGLVWIASGRDRTFQLECAELLRKHHLVHPETITLAKNMKTSGCGWVESLLRAQLASAELPKDQTWRVRLALAMCLQNQAKLPALLSDASEADSQQFLEVFGKDGVAEIKKYDTAKLESEAIALFKDLAEKFPKQGIIPGLTVGDLAKSSIFEIENLGVGKVAPDISGEDLDGVAFRLREYRGRVVMLSFWASWCGPCMGLIPHERELVERFKTRPFALIGVNGDPEKKDLKKVLADHKITWRSFWAGEKGPEGPIPMAWNVNDWPTIYLIDEKGVIRSKTAMGKTLDTQIEKLVAEAEKTKPKK